MKNFKNYLLITFLAIGLVFTSCSKDDDASGDEFPIGEVHFTAKIDGEKFIATEVEAIEGDVEGVYSLIIMSENNEGQTFLIGVNNFSGVGTYAVSQEDGEAGVLFFDQSLETGWWGEAGGEIVITHHIEGERVKGTFTFPMNNLDNSEREVTEGSFESIVVLE